MAHNRLQDGGWARQVTQRELPAATETGVNMCLKPGGIRELHWHKQAEWAFMLWGRARISGVDQNGQNFLDDVGPGDMWNFPAVIPHSIQGLEEGCEILLIFDDGNFSKDSTFLITDWFNCTTKRKNVCGTNTPKQSFPIYGVVESMKDSTGNEMLKAQQQAVQRTEK